jgi:hypothetical protein
MNACWNFLIANAKNALDHLPEHLRESMGAAIDECEADLKKSDSDREIMDVIDEYQRSILEKRTYINARSWELGCADTAFSKILEIWKIKTDATIVEADLRIPRTEICGFCATERVVSP